MCLRDRHTPTYEFYSKFYLEHGLILSPDTEVATIDQILPMILHNLGIGFLPEKLARDAISKGDVYKRQNQSHDHDIYKRVIIISGK